MYTCRRNTPVEWLSLACMKIGWVFCVLCYLTACVTVPPQSYSESPQSSEQQVSEHLAQPEVDESPEHLAQTEVDESPEPSATTLSSHIWVPPPIIDGAAPTEDDFNAKVAARLQTREEQRRGLAVLISGAGFMAGSAHILGFTLLGGGHSCGNLRCSRCRYRWPLSTDHRRFSLFEQSEAFAG